MVATPSSSVVVELAQLISENSYIEAIGLHPKDFQELKTAMSSHAIFPCDETKTRFMGVLLVKDSVFTHEGLVLLKFKNAEIPSYQILSHFLRQP